MPRQSRENRLFDRLVILPRTPLKWWLALIGIVAAVAWMVLVSWLPLLPGAGESAKFAGYMVLCVLSMLLCARPLSRWHLGLHGPAPTEVGGQSNPGWVRPVMAAMLALVGLMLVSEVFSRSSEEAAESIIQVFQSLGFGQSLANDIWIACAVTVFAPLGEEALFRALIMRSLYDGLRNLRGKWLSWLSFPVVALVVAVLLSSVVFAHSHGSDEQSIQVYALGVMGAIYALSYAVSGSLFVPVMAHSISNALGLLLVVWEMPAGSVSTVAQVGMWVGPPIAFLMLLMWRQIIRG